METADYPLISILMAVYEPRMDWLREQFRSLNAQTYPNCRLYILDDCSPGTDPEEIRRAAQECVTAIPWTLARNERNLGSTSTFERLTAEAEGEYFAYCDQDDVWLPEKLSTLWEAMETENALLVCSDMRVIDSEGKLRAESVTEVYPRQVFQSGEGLAPVFLSDNFVTGCAMLIRAEIAKAAIPFCPSMVHDRYLALYAAQRGKIISLPQPLLKYRIHGTNQTVPMPGVHDKESYFRHMIGRNLDIFTWLLENLPMENAMERECRERLRWYRAREALFRGERKRAAEVWRYRRFNRGVSLFEILMDRAPERLFMLGVAYKKRR